MILTNEQEQALKIILNKYKNHEKYVTICGYAGVGKSTLAKFAIAAIDVEPSKVAYATFTGKAAEVLRKKGNPNAITLHRLLYDSIPQSDGTFMHVPKNTLDYKVVLVDEISMAPKSMLDRLLSYPNVFCIFMGDNFQLPQLNKDEAHDFLIHPDIFLSKVMRQAAESEIIQLTMTIREEKPIPFMKGKEVIVMPKKELVDGCYTWADQIICATNNTRIAINNQVRTMLGYEGLPQDGEKMMCLHNYWSVLSKDGDAALVNGMTGTLRNPFETYRYAPKYVKMRNHKMDIIVGDFITDDGSYFKNINMDKKLILEGEYSLNWKEDYALGKLVPRMGDIRPRQFTFSYCATCHKCQGSQWPKVLVIEEKFPFDKLEHRRWLYTACTRPEDKLVLVR